MINLKNKKVLVVGIGKSGISSARYAASCGAHVTVTDAKSNSELADSLAKLQGLDISYALGGQDAKAFQNAEFIIVSPGVPLELPQILAAKKRNIPVVGELELAVGLLKTPTIAVTGTNGKTTTASLIGHLLNNSDVSALVAGNIGTPLLDVIDEANSSDVVVLEVSSFQLDTTPSLAPDISILLNVTPDHLDRHATLESYIESKARLTKNTKKWGIYNAADESVSSAVISSKCHLVPFDATGKILTEDKGKISAWYEDGNLVVASSVNGFVTYSIDNVKLEGIHNRENMLAALLASELLGADNSRLQSALETFKGLPHRVELVGEHKGVRYYDDSKGTNIGATIRALQGFAEPVVLIAGGLSKGVDFAPLKNSVKEHVKKLVLIGEAAGEMEKVLSGSAGVAKATSMDEAVKMASKFAEPGDVVLLSPACASFDMFKDYVDRGVKFVEAVKKVASEK